MPSDQDSKTKKQVKSIPLDILKYICIILKENVTSNIEDAQLKYLFLCYQQNQQQSGK